jgi:hypothetical protein
VATNSNSDDHLLLLRAELAELREAVELLHADVMISRAELDELLTTMKVLVAALAAAR